MNKEKQRGNPRQIVIVTICLLNQPVSRNSLGGKLPNLSLSISSSISAKEEKKEN